MKILLTRITPLFILAIAFTFNSCKKKCDLPGDANLGEINNQVTLFPEDQLTNGDPSTYLITGSSSNANTIQMSLDGGVTKTPVNYGEYSILCYPTTTTCNTSFTRSVEIDDINGIVIYTITTDQCETCDETRTVENIVAIRAVPDSYQVVFDID